MYSFVFITHGRLGEILLETASQIMEEDVSGRCSFFTIEFSMASELEKIKEEINSSVESFLSKGMKVIIFVDLFGGSPSNIAFSIAKNEAVDIISGVNLSMTVYAIEHMNSEKPLQAIVEEIMRSGVQNITSAKKLLMSKGENEKN
ncbi:MAG: PTS sugar transporter subunit IIA [bacterium]